MLPGMVPIGVVSMMPVDCSYIGKYSSATNSFANVGFGAVSPMRRVYIVGSVTRTDAPGNDTTITGVIIGGIPATIHVQNQSLLASNTRPVLFIASAVVPTGTSGTVVITADQPISGGYVGSFMALNARVPNYHAGYSANSSTANPDTISVSLNTLNDGVLLAIASDAQTSGPTFTSGPSSVDTVTNQYASNTLLRWGMLTSTNYGSVTTTFGNGSNARSNLVCISIG